MAKEMTIPEVRDELYELAERLDSNRLRYLADQLHRRKAVRAAPIRSEPVTPLLVREIRLFADLHPGWTEAQIGQKFHVNQGRVSEALAGFRGVN